MVRFIHAADLHLDSPFNGLQSMPEKYLKEVRESTFQAIAMLVENAIKRQVDFVLISGDIYDSDDRSIRAQAFFRKKMNMLQKHGIEVYLIHGNHDYVTEGAAHLKMPENVHIFGEKPESKTFQTSEGELVCLTGFSYHKKWITEKKIEDYPMRKQGADWHIGMLHGYFEGGSEQHAKYAPFTMQDLKRKGYDYWALGHIHKRQILSQHPLICYPGNTQGRNKKESGEKGFLLVELSEAEQKIEFIPTASIEWFNLRINACDVTEINDLFQMIENKMLFLRSMEVDLIVSLTLEMQQENYTSLSTKILNGELLAAFQHAAGEKPFVWVNEIRIETRKEGAYSSIANVFHSEWENAVADMRETNALSKILEDFFRNASSSDGLPIEEAEFREELVNNAIRLAESAIGEEN